jgi:hypothetical protein
LYLLETADNNHGGECAISAHAARAPKAARLLFFLQKQGPGGRPPLAPDLL